MQFGEWDSAQKQLDGFVAHDGAAVAAINDDTSVEARVVGMDAYGLTDFGGIVYLGAVLTVEVLV